MNRSTQFESLGGRRQVAAIVFTDAANSCSSMGRAEREMVLMLERDFAAMSRICNRLGGRVIKTIGDGLLLSFPSALDAVRFAVRSQQHFSRRSSVDGSNACLRHRIAIHIGDVLVSRSDIMGEGVNIAARVLSETEPGGICITQVVYDLVRKRLALRTDCLGFRELRNIEERIAIYRVFLESQGASRFAGLAGMVSAVRRRFRKPVTGGAMGLALVAIGVAGLAVGSYRQISQARSPDDGRVRPQVVVPARPERNGAPRAFGPGGRDPRFPAQAPVGVAARRPERS